MVYRTDLALEAVEELNVLPEGIESEQEKLGSTVISRVKITDEMQGERIGKRPGNYITIEVPPFSDNGGFDENCHTAIKSELLRLMPTEGTVLVVGIGNTDITPDAFGPKTADGILATRHISGELARSVGLDGLRSVAVISPGVLGRTGIESFEIIKSVTEQIRPSCIICIDALAAKSLNRLGNTVQISDSGISPGSGVGNRRVELSRATLGVEIIAVGVPTVVDAATLVCDLAQKELPADSHEFNMIVTPREIDLMIDRSAEAVSFAVNCALQQNIDPKILQGLV